MLGATPGEQHYSIPFRTIILGSSHHYTDWHSMQPFEACIIKNSIWFHSGWHLALLYDVSDVTTNEMFSW